MHFWKYCLFVYPSSAVRCLRLPRQFHWLGGYNPGCVATLTQDTKPSVQEFGIDLEFIQSAGNAHHKLYLSLKYTDTLFILARQSFSQ